MKVRSRKGSHRAILIVGVLLGLYLATLIGVAYVGQARLQDALIEQEQLSIEKQATAFSYFLASQQAIVDELSASRSVHGFLANRDLGMSMRYGLRASLMTIARDFRHTLETKRIGDTPIFASIAFVENNGQGLLEVHTDTAYDADTLNPREAVGPGQLVLEHHEHGVHLTFSSAIEHKGEIAGYIAADVNAATILRPLLSDSGSARQRRRTALIDQDDSIVVASDGHDWHNWRNQAAANDEKLIEAAVAGGRFKVVNFPDVDALRGMLASPWFLAALALMALPLLFGVAHLLRLSKHNLVLQARFQSNREQRAVLRKQNERLQREIDKRLESEEQLAHQANYDQLTGLPNRNLALDRLAQALKWAKRERGSVVVLFLDLDRFKQVNDSLGHAAGDELLRDAAQRLLAQVRDSDTVSRLGGDEFLVVCPEPEHHRDWERIAQGMLKTLSQPFYVGDHEFFVGASIGVAAYPDGGTEPHKLMKNADIAMYSAKEKGRNRYCYYDPSMDLQAMEAMKLENNLRHALSRDEFHLMYQPIVDLSSGRTVAVEALLRWTSAEMGNVPPDKFIPIAEETGVIHEIGEWVLTEACRQVGSLCRDPDFRLAVNLSSRQFSRPGRLLDCVLMALRQSGMMPSQLELEFTESILIDDRAEIGEFINQLDRIGVRLSIDDFGTGYSALNYLQRFPFDILKIDRSFTNQLPDNEASSSLIRAIIAMAHALGLEVIAEGIEDRRQTGFLLVHHCEFGQGYLYSKPLTLNDLREHLATAQAMIA